MRYLACLVLASLLTGIGGCYTNATPAPIVVGHVSDKTRLDKAGDQAELGIRLALNELTKEASLADALGGRSIQVRHTDTRGELDGFESRAVRLDSLNRAVALFGGLSATEVTALDHVKIPLLTFHGQPVSGAGKHVFYLGMSPARQGFVLAKSTDAKAKRVGVLIDERLPEADRAADRFMQTLTDARKEQKADRPEFLTLRFGKEPKWNELIERLNAHEAQAILFAGSVKDFNAWQDAHRKSSTLDDPQLIFAGGDGEHRLFDVVPELKTRILLATAYYADPASSKVGAFEKAYREAFKVEPDVNSALAYDGFRLFAEALKRAYPNHTGGDKLRDGLLATKDFAGLTGPLTLTAERTVDRPLFVMQWRQGALTLVKKSEAAP